VRVADGVDDQPGQVDGLADQRTTVIQPCQQQHVLDQLRHPSGLGLDPAHRVGDVVGGVGRACAVQARCSRESQPAACATRGWRRRRTARTLVSLACRTDMAPAMRSSIRFSAEPSWPDLGVATLRVDAHDQRRQTHLALVKLEVGDLAGRSGNP